MNKVTFILFFITLLITRVSSNSYDSIRYYLGNYQPNVALDLIDEQINKGNENSFLFYLQARAYKNLFNMSNSIQSIEKSLSMDSARLSTWFMAADLYNVAGDYGSCISAYQKILLVDSNNTQANFKLANVYYKTENYLRAVAHYGQVVINDSSNWFALRSLAKSFEKLAFPGELTIPSYYNVLKHNPDDKLSKQRITKIYLAEKKYREAVEASNDFLTTDSLNTNLLSLNGFAYIQEHGQDSAIRSFQKCLELNDTSFFNYKYLGLAYYNKRNYKKSIDYLEKAYAQSKIDPYTNYYLGAAWGRSLEKEKAITYLKETIELLQPDASFLSKSYTELGKAYAEMNQFPEAENAYQTAYNYNNSNFDLYFLMGMYYYKEDKVLAEKYLTMYIDSTLANNENSAKYKYYRSRSKEYIKQIEEDKFWQGTSDSK